MGKLQNRIVPRVFFYAIVHLFVFTDDKCGCINNIIILCIFSRFLNSVIIIATFVLLLNGVRMRLIHSSNILNN